MTKEIITLDYLQVFLVDLPQKHVFQSGIGTRKSKETLIIKWVDREGRIGYGECSCRPDPYYSAEFLRAAIQLIKQFIAPILEEQQSYTAVLNGLKRIRGWNFTKAGIEAAMFQVAQQLSAEDLLDQQLDNSRIQKVPVGISLGIYQDVHQLRKVVEEALESGYHRLKFKIAPSVNLKHFDQIKTLLLEKEVYVSFDANGSYTTADLDHLGYFINTFDAFIEQAMPPSRFDYLLAAKQRFPHLKNCFDEEVKSLGDLVKLHQLGLLDQLNLKIGRVGGISHSIDILNYCHQHNIDCWIGGMFETGIGRMLNLELAAFLPNAKAHDLSPSSRYFKEDLIAPGVTMKEGYISLDTALQGEVIEARIQKYCKEQFEIKKP
ncbi:MAG: o-succinylbenzoate synthase [Bacteroidota bacterium]